MSNNGKNNTLKLQIQTNIRRVFGYPTHQLFSVNMVSVRECTRAVLGHICAPCLVKTHAPGFVTLIRAVLGQNTRAVLGQQQTTIRE